MVVYNADRIEPPWRVSQNIDFLILIRSYSWFLEHREEICLWAEHELEEVVLIEQTFIKLYMSNEKQLTYFKLRWG